MDAAVDSLSESLKYRETNTTVRRGAARATSILPLAALSTADASRNGPPTIAQHFRAAAGARGAVAVQVVVRAAACAVAASHWQHPASDAVVVNVSDWVHDVILSVGCRNVPEVTCIQAEQ